VVRRGRPVLVNDGAAADHPGQGLPPGQAPLATVNLTPVCFFATYCGFLLVYGPLSDRYGRRPPLLAGIGLFVAASLFCAMAGGVETMIIARIAQGAGAASASASALAISKDMFTGQVRQRIFIQLGIITAAAPMLAPVVGGWVISLTSWRFIFVIQALLGSVAFFGVVRLKETLHTIVAEPLSRVASNYARLFRNRRYILLALKFAVMGMPFFAFIAASPDIYITRLGYGERQYGYFFALNSAAFMVAPMAFSRAIRKRPLMRLLPFGFLGMACSALVMAVPLLPDTWRITLPMWFFTFSFSVHPPPRQQPHSRAGRDGCRHGRIVHGLHLFHHRRLFDVGHLPRLGRQDHDPRLARGRVIRLHHLCLVSAAPPGHPASTLIPAVMRVSGRPRPPISGRWSPGDCHFTAALVP
jgi:DHA1 family bicyclomycin/chloramphenicol resistance-like MFS transporter